MSYRTRRRVQDEQGFTLVELLVVILIIGILAAIALPFFLWQGEKAQDSPAKANARNLVSHIESCFTDDETYADCHTTLTVVNTGLPLVAGGAANAAAVPSGQVAVLTGATDRRYVIVAKSQNGRTYTITHDAATGNARICGPSGGGCEGSSW